MNAVVRYAVAALFAWAGATAVLYAPVAPLLPSLIERPVPALAIGLGTAHLGVAVGLIRRWRWVRPCGIALVLVDAATHAILLAASATSTGAGGLYLVVIAAGELIVDGALVLALVAGLKPTSDRRSTAAR